VGIEKRLARLEGRPRSANAAPLRSEAERRQRWLRRQREARRQRTPKCVFHARSYIAWLRVVGKLGSFASAAELVEKILEAPDASGYRQPPETRSRGVIEREVYAAIRRRDEGLGHLRIPPEWEAALGASETMRDAYLAMPAEHVASWWLEARELQERGEPNLEDLEEHARRYEEPYGITEELLRAALGPNGARRSCSGEERGWMLRAPMEDAVAAEEQRWQATQVIRRIEAEQAN
jgi:hypothetical protein